MATGLSNKLTGQIGEYLVCAELGKRGYIATSFTGNVPEFDIVAIRDNLKTKLIQVKTTRSSNWPEDIHRWMEIEFDEINKTQKDCGDKKLKDGNLIFICVALAEVDSQNKDKFFVIRKKDLQKIVNSNYRKYMNPKNWKRPKNYSSKDVRYSIDELIKYEDNWILLDKNR